MGKVIGALLLIWLVLTGMTACMNGVSDLLDNSEEVAAQEAAEQAIVQSEATQRITQARQQCGVVGSEDSIFVALDTRRDEPSDYACVWRALGLPAQMDMSPDGHGWENGIYITMTSGPGYSVYFGATALHRSMD